jgi:hypothetical protein
MDAPVEVSTLDLAGVQCAEKGVAKVRATLMLDKNLMGRFTV